MDELLELLRADAGILHIETHAARQPPDDVGGEEFQFEAWRNDLSNPENPCHAAKSALDSYVGAGKTTLEETFLYEAPGRQVDDSGKLKEGYCVLRARPAFVTRHTTGKHTIVHGMFCGSHQMATAWLASANVRDFVGYADKVPTGNILTEFLGFNYNNALGRTQLVFENMAGASSEAGSFANQPIGIAVGAANGVLGGTPVQLSSDGSTPNPALLRLYNAPRIVFSQVKQDVGLRGAFDHVVYNFPADSAFAGKYPYNDGSDYPGPPGRAGFLKTGPITLNLGFSEPMSSLDGDYQIYLRYSDGRTYDLTGFGQWRSNAVPNDSWSITFEVPQDAAEGRVFVDIKAKRISAGDGQDFLNQYLDLIGTGLSSPGAVDSTTSFWIDRTKPFVGLQDSLGPIEDGISNGQQVSISADDRRGGGGAAAAAVSGLDRVELWQGDAVTGELLGANDTDYPTNHDYTLADLGIFSALPEGRITVRVLDQAGNESTVSFTVDKIFPQVRARDDNFEYIADEGILRTDQISIEGLDLRADGATPGSGIAKISLTQTEGGNFHEEKSFASLPVAESVNFPLTGGVLPRGKYLAEVTDAAGNMSVLRFTAAWPLPTFSVRDERGNLVAEGQTVIKSKSFTVEFLSSPNGIGLVTLTTDAGYVFSHDFGGGNPATHRFGPISPSLAGHFTLRVEDAAGQPATFEFADDFGVVFNIKLDQASGSGKALTVYEENVVPIYVTGLAKAGFDLRDTASGIAAWELSRDGTRLLGNNYAFPYPGSISAALSSPSLGPGTYTYTAVSGSSLRSSGIIVVYDYGLQLDRTGTRLVAIDPATKEMLYTVALRWQSTAPWGAGRVELYKTLNPTQGELIIGPLVETMRPVAGEAALLTVDSQLQAGTYVALAYDSEGLVASRFSFMLDRADVIVEEAAATLRPIGNAEVIGGALTLRKDDLGLFMSEGAAESPPIDLMARTAPGLKDYVVGAALFPPALSGGGDINFDRLPPAPQEPPLPPTNPAGASLTFSVAVGVDGANFGPMTELSVVVPVPDPDTQGYKTAEVPREPLLLQPFIQYRFDLRANAERTAAPVVRLTYFTPRLATAVAVPSAFPFFYSRTPDGICELFIGNPDETCLLYNQPVPLVAGLYRLGLPYIVDPSSTTPSGDAKITLKFSRQASEAEGFDLSSLKLYQLPPGATAWALAPGQSTDLVNENITAFLSIARDTVFAIFGAKSGPIGDLAPPTSFVSIDSPLRRAEYAAAPAAAVLSASDDASGVARTYFALDPSAELLAGGLSAGTASLFQVYGGSIPLAEGARVLAYGSVDLAGNYEALKSTAVRVDATPPVVSISSDVELFRLSAQDPLVAGVASGVRRIFYLIDGDPAQCHGEPDPLSPPGTCANPIYGGPFAVPSGSHIIHFGATDNVENTFSSSAAVIVPEVPLSLAAIAPASGENTGDVPVAVDGTGFKSGAALALSRPGAAWTASGSMSQRRIGHSAFLLPSGKALVAGGGAGGNSPTRVAELYDPATRTWSPTGSLATARYLPSLAQLPDGKVLAVGGFLDSGGFTVYATAELYDPVTGQWTPAGALPNGRWQAALTTLADGRVLLSGGRGAGSLVYTDSFIYDPATNAWTPAGAMSHPRGDSRSVRLLDGRVLVVGGVDNNGSNSSDIYDPATNSWTQGPNLNQGRYSHTITLLKDGRVLITGGTSQGYLDSAEVYDPATNAWTLTAKMPQPRGFHRAERLPDGRVLLFGDSSSPTSVFYDPATGAWSAGPDLSMARSSLAGVSLSGGAVLAIGGWGNGRAQETVEALETQTISAQGAAVVSARRLTATLPLAGKPAGLWNVVVANPDGASASLPNGFEVIVPPPPAIESVSPSSGVNTGTITVTLEGASFRPGASFALVREGLRVQASSVAFLSAAGLSGTLDFSGAAPGLWSVEATNPDGQKGTLADAFTVYEPDRTPPVYGAGEVSGDGLAWSMAETMVLRSTPAWARVVVEDAGVGLIGPAGVPAPTARFTADAGATWTGVHASSLSWTLMPGGAEGRGPYRFAAAGLPLILSAPAGSNRVEWTVSDAAGNVAVATTTILAAPPPPTIASISPDHGDASSPMVVTVAGSGFREGASLALSRPALGPWTAGASMAQPRISHSAFLLPGGELLVAGGGSGGSSPTRVAELFDPATSAWSLTGAMLTARYLPSMAQLPDGRVLAVGGFLDSGGLNVYASAELYDPATGVWTAAASLPNGRYHAALATLSDGRVLLAGGRGAGSLVYGDSFIYAPASNAWIPAGTMSHQRGDSRAVRLKDGRVLVVGGVDNNGSNSSDLYDSATGRWSPGPFLNQGRYSHTATLLQDGRVLVTGGTSQGYLDTAELFDPALNTWTLTPRMPEPRAFHQAQLLPDGRVLLYGDSVSATSTFYDPVTDTWSAGPDLSMARSTLAGFTLPDGRVLALGGWGDGRAQQTVEVLGVQRLVAAAVSVASPESLSGTLDLTGAPTGYWTVAVANPDGQSATLASGFEVLARVLLEPTTGPIGTAFVLRGAGFGAFAAGGSRVLFGAVPAPVSSWTDFEVSGSVPGVSPGAYVVTVEGGPRTRRAGTFTVLLPEINSVSPLAARAGAALTVRGSAFGAYAEGLARLRVGVATAAVTAWSDGEILASLPPEAPEGRQPLWVERASLDGGLAASATASLLLDYTAPVSTLAALTGNRVVVGTVYAATTSWRLSAYDPVPAGEASGVASMRLSLDGGPFLESSELILAEGFHELAFLAEDAAGNIESTRAARVVVDLTPPVPLADLAVVEVTTWSARLAWTAAGSDAVELLVEYSSGAQAARLVVPLIGQTELLLADLDAGSDYSFSLRTGDLAGNLSPVSTVAARTLSLAASPDGVATLVSPEAQITVIPTPTVEQATAYTIATSSQGLKLLTTTFYELSGGPVVFSTPAVLTFTFFPEGVDLGQVAIYRWNGVYWDSAPVSSQQLTLMADGSYQITGLLELTSLYAVFERLDVRAPRTELAVGQPRAEGVSAVYVSSATALTLTSLDDLLESGDGVGLGVALQEVLFGTTALSFVNPAPAKGESFSSSFRLSGQDGLYALSYQARDLFGNLEPSRSAVFALDGTPPVSALGIGQPQALLGEAVLVSSATPLWVDAADPESGLVASGVGGAFHAVDGGAASAGQPFSLGGPDGTRTVGFHAEDRVGNVETAKILALIVDSSAPGLSLDLGGGGLASVVAGQVEVRGSAADPHLREYRLEAAAGRDAGEGFVLLSSGAASASGVLALWDASALSGWQTMRLSASDLVGNASAVSVSVYVGEPARVLVLGDHKTFTMPEAVAVGADGRIYAADTGADRVLVFDSTGTPLAVFPGFSKPRGVAVDEGGSVFVADTGSGRVVKLSAAGEVLLEIPGFKRPAGVALGPDGVIVVADAGHRRLQVLTSTGAVVLSVPLPPGPEEDDDEPRPWGVAADAAGRLYAADPPGGRALVFGADGSLLRAISIPAASDKEARPHGIAVSPAGDALFVSERQSGRVYRFDGQARRTLSFGTHGKLKDGKPLPKALVFNKPMGLALGSDGSLYVADRNNDRIQRLSLPTGETAVVAPPPQEGGDLAVADVLDTEEGGSVSRGDKAGVAVPAGALQADTKITVAAASAADEKARREKAEDAGLKPVSAPVEFSPHGTRFDKPVTLTLPYSEELALAQNASPAALAVAYWNEKSSAWEPLESKVDIHNRTVSAKTKHFSLYQVVGSTGGATTAAAAPAVDESFVFRDLYVYPNPARAGAVPKLHLAVGVADKVRFKIFDAAGRPVHDATLDGRPAVIDDGKGPAYAYEHAWEGRIPSGVYLFVVEAEKTGSPPIRKAGRFGVVR